ncbi:enoyl-ACP reductase FabI [Streptomyces thermodiastaticus]|jgi:enoyl-[acyl-carrier protein] reductase I|uniref:enoyl-ACP reductase FabI n=1 Tax=Streptomyces thermodiastaticus TaxID=44061 RepID=UPI001675EAF4|nr:enoyl-ACP reductase FabI [Streptomyces thermodiastaticus]MCE7551406.1 enoyl-ACP reductase FabI [Streptomyces thermodiastaticus]GHF86474.1 enoyl-[acyl-carrier-protein] reductase [NADH] [Streptomyces thermodiastaticus]
MSGILHGKNILITGMLSEKSIAFHAARLAQREGARVVLTAFGRRSLVELTAKRLPEPAPVVDLDVQNQEHLDTLADRVAEHLGEEPALDGVVHSIAFAPQDALGGNFLNTGWSSVATSLEVSAYSLKALTIAVLPLLEHRGGAVVGLDFDARQAWPHYDWMGVSKAALEAVNRYLARYLGGRSIRCNLVSAGPIRSMAAKSIPGFAELAEASTSRATLGWDLEDPEPAARGVVALLSDWFPRTTGEIVHVDGGTHMVGA